ncbi:MAG: general secretion pathway protein GspB [Burkholderiaceae bacterium]|nr:general secretion pathway protein GspB [Burkholderiaceae bacterium]
MSYILDALKKAEAQRHLGDVPSIHAGAPGKSGQIEDVPFVRKHLPWLTAGLLALVIVGYVLWSHPWSQAPAAVAPVPPQPVAHEAAPLAQAPVPAPAPVTSAPATPVPAAPLHQAAPVMEKPARPTAPPVAAIEKPKAEAAKPLTPPPAAAPAPEEEAGTMQDLPAFIQRELPPVSINGYIYAKNPAERTAIINKRLLHEGESVAPDLVLEKLTPKGAVLNYKGYRYRISY